MADLTVSSVIDTFMGSASEAAMRSNISLVVGTDVQAWDADLDALAGLASAADRLPYFTASQTAALATFTAFARTLLDDATQGAMQTTLDVDPSGTDNSTDVTLVGSPDYITLVGQVITRALINLTTHVTGTLPIANGGTAATTASGARTALGLAIGTDVQAFDALLLSIAGLTTAADRMIYTTASDTAAVATLTSFARTFLDDANAAAVHTTLGLVIGTDVQAFDAELAAIATVTSAADALPYFTGLGTATTTTLTTFGRSLIDDTTASAARTTLGLAIGTDVQEELSGATLTAATVAANRQDYRSGHGRQRQSEDLYRLKHRSPIRSPDDL